ncbi:hypothetical protein RHMOL_Rhmol01G0153600 [Rhododendron molle]|uniref:Uncharacterized protein n=1 Tax=Rhododendron molle TaxID=49168 RepID=A0ACC0Q4G3_RHOML|nr:hypothetical protein RHMOL_Rhmol01G0153600 [Rhododendron molle]
MAAAWWGGLGGVVGMVVVTVIADVVVVVVECDGISLTSLFSQVEMTNLSYNCTINKEEEKVIKPRLTFPFGDYSCLKEVAIMQVVKTGPVHGLCLARKRVEKSIKLQKAKEKRTTSKCYSR